MKEGTKILHVLWTGSIGGAQRAVYQLVQAQLRSSRFIPSVAFAVPSGHYYDKIRTLGCEVLSLPLRSDRNPLRAMRVKPALKHFPVHHFHSAEVTISVASILCRGAVRVYTHRGGFASYEGRSRIRYPVMGYFLRNFFHGLSGNTLHACWAGSTLFGIPQDRWSVTYNGLDFASLEPKAKAEDLPARFVHNGHPVIGTAAHIRSWKRIDLLLEACGRLRNKSFSLLILGDGPDRRRLENLTHQLGLTDLVHFAGMKDNVSSYLSLMDIFVLPSMQLESFGNAAVEAMALGKPTIVFEDGGGLVEHVKDGASGYVVKSVDELASRLGELISNGDLRFSLGANARSFVRERYTVEKMVKAYDDLYETAMVNYSGKV